MNPGKAFCPYVISNEEAVDMIHLFPKQKNRMIIVLGVYLALAAFLLIIGSGNPIATCLLSVFGFILVVGAEVSAATNHHSQLLNQLYNQLDVDGFLREYEPKLQIKLKNQNTALMVRLHLSNAYCAQGLFDDAIALLFSVTVKEGKSHEETLLARFAIVSNLCYCAEQKSDIETAQKYLDELLSLRRELESLQQAKPEKKRMVFSTELNEQCMVFLKTGKADVEKLKELTRQNKTHQLQRITSSLWVARAMLAENNRREAESILEQIVKLSPGLYPGKEAAKLLAALPARPEKG